MLYSDAFEILVPCTNGRCEVVDFLSEMHGNANTSASAEGLQTMLEHVAKYGLTELPSAWVHEADKPKKVMEFVKGDLRLMFFKGIGTQIAVCVAGVVKKGQKANPKAVNATAKARAEYLEAVKNKTLEVIA